MCRRKPSNLHSSRGQTHGWIHTANPGRRKLRCTCVFHSFLANRLSSKCLSVPGIGIEAIAISHKPKSNPSLGRISSLEYSSVTPSSHVVKTTVINVCVFDEKTHCLIELSGEVGKERSYQFVSGMLGKDISRKDLQSSSLWELNAWTIQRMGQSAVGVEERCKFKRD